jgi:hypothetical protein
MLRAVRLLESVTAGVLAVVIAEVVVILLLVGGPLAVTAFQFRASGGDVGGGSFSINAGFLLLIAVVAGVAGFVWQWRRGRGTPVH